MNYGGKLLKVFRIFRSHIAFIILSNKNGKVALFLFCNFLLFTSFQNCQRSTLKVDESSLTANFTSFQWYLKNTGELGGLAGQDINVDSVWASGIKGKNINVAIVDTGIQLGHSDLLMNASPLSYNFAMPSKGTDTSAPGGAHGTCVAGIIGAMDNDYGVTGVAPEVGLVGYNIFGWVDAYEQGALTSEINGVSQANKIDVSNNSWGPPDNTGGYSPTENFWVQAIETGLSNGRGGLGTVYVWAAGNGALGGDRSNYDGMANYHGVIATCAVGDSGQRAQYSEAGSNLWVCGYGGDSAGGQLIATTDFEGSGGFNRGGGQSGDFSDSRYTKEFVGTSAAAPVVSGVTALILEKAKAVGKSLSWRDVKWILAKSAKAPPNTTITKNGYELPIFDDFGFGIVDAESAVNLVSSWTTVGPVKKADLPSSGMQSVVSAIPKSATSPLISTLTVATSNPTQISRLEWVDLKIDLSHSDWSKLVITLSHVGNNVSGAYTTRDIITQKHDCWSEDSNGNYNAVVCSSLDNNGSSDYNFRFGISRHLGESPVGSWELKIYDGSTGSNSGTLNSWSLSFRGE